MKDGQRFIVKVIKTEADLPKEYNFYIFGFKNGTVSGMNYYQHDEVDILKHCLWYLQPIEEQELNKKKSKEFSKGYKEGLQIDKSGL